MDPYNMPKGFTAHLGRHENRLSRPVMPFGGKLHEVNTQRLKDGLPALHPTKGWQTPKRKLVPGYKPPERKSAATEAKNLIYAFLGYW